MAASGQYFILVTPGDLAEACVADGVARLPEDQTLPRLAEGDRLVVYAPRTAIRNGDRVEAFVAIGTVEDAGTENPRVAWRSDASPAPIHPLLARLDLTRLLGAQWEELFAAGSIAVSADDFVLIATAMRRETAPEAGPA